MKIMRRVDDTAASITPTMFGIDKQVNRGHMLMPAAFLVFSPAGFFPIAKYRCPEAALTER